MALSQTSEEKVDASSGVERLSKLLHGSKEIIAIFINIITAIVLFYTQDPKNHHYDKFLLFIEILNIVTLLIAIMILSKKYNWELDQKKESDNEELTELVKLEKGYNLEDLSETNKEGLAQAKKVVLKKINRINLVIQQVINSHRGFAISLIFLYSLLFIYNASQVNEKDTIKSNGEKFEKEKKDSDAVYNKKVNISNAQYLNIRANQLGDPKPSPVERSSNLAYIDSIYVHLIKVTKLDSTAHLTELARNHQADINKLNEKYPHANLDTFRTEKLKKTTSIAGILLSPNLENKSVISYLVLAITDIFFNILSGCFLFIAFSILYSETIEKDNITPKINYLPPFAVGGAIFLFVALSITIGFYNFPLQTLVVITRIISGLFNGIAMALIFSRFISIEFFFKRSNIINRYYYLIGTIVILPAYAVVQPLFGLFETDYSGNQDFLASAVLLICLWGKIFFFLLLYTMLKNRWLHAYIYTLRFSEERIKEITEKIHVITNLNE